MDIDQKLLQKLNKLYTLAERGADNEKDVALNKLNNILKQNNLELDDILESQQVYTEIFTFKNKYDKKILLQCIYKVIGDTDRWNDFNIYRPYRSRTKIQIDCTKLEKVEILLEYEFYSQYLEKELDVYVQSFIQANKIFPNNGEVVEIDRDNIDEETLRMLNLSGMIKRKTRYLEIEERK